MVRHSLYVLFLYIFQRNTILRNLFSNVLCSMKMFELRLKFHWSLFPGVQLTLLQHWCRQWLGAVQATSHYLNQWWLVYRRIYASVGLNELKTSLFSIQLNWHTRGKWLIHGAKYFKDNHNHKNHKAWKTPAEYPSGEYKPGPMECYGNELYPISPKKFRNDKDR